MHQSKYALSSDTPDIVLSSVFKKYDVDSSGELELQEFQRALSDLGVIDEYEQEALFHLADADNGGSVEVEEFIKLIKATEFDHILEDHESLEFIYQTHKTFQEFDDDGNGEISWDEFYFYLTKKGYSHQSISQHWHFLDQDKSSVVTFEEFWKGYKAMAEAQQKQLEQQQQQQQQNGNEDDMDEEDEKEKAIQAEKKKRSTLLDRSDSAKKLTFDNDDNEMNILNKVKQKLKKSSHKMNESEFKVKVGKVLEDDMVDEKNQDEDKKKKKKKKNGKEDAIDIGDITPLD